MLAGVGWHEGFLSDGRPYRIEAWTQFQIVCVTVFLSSAGIEQWSNEQLADLLEREKIVRFHSGKQRYVDAKSLPDASGNPIWSINVVIGAYDEPAIADYLPLGPFDG